MTRTGFAALIVIGVMCIIVVAAKFLPAQEVEGGEPVIVTSAGEETAMQTKTVFDFDAPHNEPGWRVVNDTVMGGVSDSTFGFTPQGTAIFTGDVSLQNNGGFASVRSAPRALDLAGSEGILLRVKGDGKRYKFSARQDSEFDGVTYQATFLTQAGEWNTVQLPFEYLYPTFRGSRLGERPPLDPTQIQSFGFLISDKQAGQFRLEVDAIVAYNAAWSGERVRLSQQKWREKLTEMQYYVTRQKGTEEAFTGKYHVHDAEGIYACVGCGNALFLSAAKFETDTGWPSFYAPLSETRVAARPDTSLGLERTEIVCARCDAHLGHVFEDGPQPTGLRYCINSAALTFEPAE